MSALVVEELQVAAGSVIGRDHALAGRNNQDASCVVRTPAALVAVVCDGCSGGAHSELGARLGAHLVASSVGRAVAGSPIDFDRVRAELLEQLRGIAALLDGRVAEHLLFTIVGAVVTADEALIFHLGDGAAWLDGERVDVPDCGVAPPYLGHALLPGREAPGFTVAARRPAADFTSLAIATDGALDFERVAPASALWTEDRFFTHPDALRRRLAVANRPPGRLPDDTTIVAVRRRRRAS